MVRETPSIDQGNTFERREERVMYSVPSETTQSSNQFAQVDVRSRQIDTDSEDRTNKNDKLHRTIPLTGFSIFRNFYHDTRTTVRSL